MFDATTVYVLTVMLIATLIRSTFGFGEALVAVPLLALRIPIAVAAPLAVSVSVLIALIVVVQDWRHIEFGAARGLIVSSIFGIPLGLLLLTLAADQIVRLILGSVIVGFSIYAIVPGTRAPVDAHRRVWMYGAGFLSGILGGAYGMNGPPLAMYGAARGWSPPQFRATLQGYFLVASLVGLAGYAAVGLWSAPVAHYVGWSIPGVCAGTLTGRWLNRRLTGAWFLRAVYLGLIVIGVVLVAQAVSA